jgi:Tol biopolymer transport system component
MVTTAVLLSATAVPAGAAPPPKIVRVSVAANGAGANHVSDDATISRDGRYVAYWSIASNLVRGDTNGRNDVFVHDRWTRRTQRVSVASGGRQTSGDDIGHPPALSGNARYVAFESEAPELVPGDTNNARDIFVHDRWNRTTVRVSVSSRGVQANGLSWEPSISADGRYVTYESFASNLVDGDADANGGIFRYDRATHRTTFIAVGTNAAQSADGRYIGFVSTAVNLVPGDTNGKADTFVYDTLTRRMSRVSAAKDGTQGNGDSDLRPKLTPNGRWVTFASLASNLVAGDTNGNADVFVVDRWTRAVTRISPPGPGPYRKGSAARWPSISDNGRYVSYGFVIPGPDPFYLATTNVYLYDRWSRRTTRVSVTLDGDANALASKPAMDATGRYVSYVSFSDLITPNDTNNVSDIFVWRRF